MTYEKAKVVGDAVVELLRPHCERIEIAGSIRRRKARVKDIEIVCIPKLVEGLGQGNFLEAVEPVRDPGFARVLDQWEKVRGDAQAGRYCQRVARGRIVDGCEARFDLDRVPGDELFEIAVDVFTTTAERWGLTFAVRTGSADFSHRVLACGWVRAGYVGHEGDLYPARDGFRIADAKPLVLREEADVFRVCRAKWVPPEERE